MTNFLFSPLQNSIKNIQTNQLRILEPSVKNSIFCKEFKRHFVNINVPTLLIYRQVYLLAYRHLRCPEVFTCEIEKDDMVDPFDESNVWIFQILDWLCSTHWSLKALSVHKKERTCEIEKDNVIDPFEKWNYSILSDWCLHTPKLGLVLSWWIVLSILQVDC